MERSDTITLIVEFNPALIFQGSFPKRRKISAGFNSHKQSSYLK